MRIYNFIFLFVLCWSLTAAEPSFSDFFDNLPRQIVSAWNKLIDVIKTPIRLRRLGRHGRLTADFGTHLDITSFVIEFDNQDKRTTPTPTTQNVSSTSHDLGSFPPEHYIYRPKTTTKPPQGINIPFLKYQSMPLEHFGEFHFRKNETEILNSTATSPQNVTEQYFDDPTNKKIMDNWPGPMKLVTEGNPTKTNNIQDSYQQGRSLSPLNKVQIPVILQPTTKKDSRGNLKISTKNDWIYFILNGSTKEIINKIDDDNTVIPLSTNPMSLFYNITRPISTKTYTKKIIHKKKITTKKPYIREIVLVSNSDFDVNK